MTKATAIPNALFDVYLKNLKPTETVVLLVIFRQTLGWIDKYGQRKKRDWITNRQFQTKTGLSERTICHALNSLIEKRLIKATDYVGNELGTKQERRGKTRIFYGPRYKPTVKHA